MSNFAQAIADGINKLGWSPDVPNEKGEMKFGSECHEVLTICEEIDKVVSSWPVVYSWQGFKNKAGSGIMPIKDEWTTMTGVPNVTHKARLAFIEEISKEPCKHEPNTYETSTIIEGFFPGHPGHFSRTESEKCILITPKCRHCGVELQATWSEKK